MDVSIEEMKSCIQEWYAQAMSYENLFEIHYAVMSECNKQAVYPLPAECCGRKALLLLRSDRPAAELLSEKG